MSQCSCGSGNRLSCQIETTGDCSKAVSQTQKVSISMSPHGYGLQDSSQKNVDFASPSSNHSCTKTSQLRLCCRHVFHLCRSSESSDLSEEKICSVDRRSTATLGLRGCHAWREDELHRVRRRPSMELLQLNQSKRYGVVHIQVL